MCNHPNIFRYTFRTLPIMARRRIYLCYACRHRLKHEGVKFIQTSRSEREAVLSYDELIGEGWEKYV